MNLEMNRYRASNNIMDINYAVISTECFNSVKVQLIIPFRCDTMSKFHNNPFRIAFMYDEGFPRIPFRHFPGSLPRGI